MGELSRRLRLHDCRIELLEQRRVLAGMPMISEFMAKNDSSLRDGDGNSSDWIEFHNSGDASIDLTGWYLTDDPSDQEKWPFPGSRSDLTRLDPGEFMLVFASGGHADANGQPVEPYVDASGFLHANFRLDADGEYLALVGPEGVASEFGSADGNFPEQFADISFGIDGQGHTVYFVEPTPGAANNFGVAGIVTDEVDFSRSGSTFTDSIQLTLTTTAEVGTIHYTLDGTVPSEASLAYTGPLTIESTTQVRARVFRDNYGPGPLRSESFVHLSSEAAEFSSPLPILVIENFDGGRIPNKRAHNPPAGDGGNIRQVERQFAQLQFFDREDGANALAAAPDLSTRAGIRVRGSSSANFRKQSLTVETWGEQDVDANVEPFGMPAESDWVLYAPSPEFDRTLLHNSFIYELSRQIGRYAVRLQFVEVFLNTNGDSISMADHAGVYIWMEKIKRDNNRVDVDRLSADGQTGGWILQSNRMQPIPLDGTEHPPNFHTKGPNRRQEGPYGRTFTGGTDRGGDDIPTGYNTFFNFESPKGEEIHPAQIDAIVSWFDAFENALYGPDFTDPEDGYRAYLDVGSFIDHALLTNLALSFDALQLSTYLFKRSENHKLELGPIWDFDRAYGADSRAADPTSNLEYTQRFMWMPRLFEDPDFAQAYQDRWQELRAGPFATDNLFAIIDSQAAEITEEVAAANGTRSWPAKLQAMKNWLAERVDAIDELHLKRPQFDQSGLAIPGSTVELSSRDGTVFYTTDGTDPRGIGGEVSPDATEAPGGTSNATALVSATAPASAIVPTESFHATFGSAWTEVEFEDSAEAGWKHGTSGIGYDENETYLPFIGLDLLSEMVDVNASLYARIEFTVDGEISAADFLHLNVRYDDGFIAYLNGVEIARSNAPTGASWDTQASTSHRDSEALEFETFDVARHVELLRTGKNVLALHGMNRRASNNDMLVQAELLVGEFARTTIDVGYSGDVVARAFDGGAWSGPAILRVAQPGDSNGDGIFNSSDLVQVFRSGEYEDDIAGNSTFEEGDWNGDGDFTTLDLVSAFRLGGYVAAARSVHNGGPGLHDLVFARLDFDDDEETDRDSELTTSTIGRH